jgi:hypothetical protein
VGEYTYCDDPESSENFVDIELRLRPQPASEQEQAAISS